MNSWLWLLGFFGLSIMQEKTQHEEDYRKATMNPEQRLAYEKLSYIRYQDQQKRTKSFWGGVGIFFVLFVIGAASLILYSDHESNIQNQKDIEANQQRAIQESQENQRKWKKDKEISQYQIKHKQELRVQLEKEFLSLPNQGLRIGVEYSKMSTKALKFFNNLQESGKCNETIEGWKVNPKNPIEGSTIPVHGFKCVIPSSHSVNSFYRITFWDDKLVSYYNSYSHKTIGHEPQ